MFALASAYFSGYWYVPLANRKERFVAKYRVDSHNPLHAFRNRSKAEQVDIKNGLGNAGYWLTFKVELKGGICYLKNIIAS